MEINLHYRVCGKMSRTNKVGLHFDKQRLSTDKVSWTTESPLYLSHTFSYKFNNVV